MTAATPAIATVRRHWRAMATGLFAMAAGLFTSQPAQAQLRVDMSGVGATQYPIAIADFANNPATQSLAEVICADLTRSGQFQLVNAAGANLNAESSIMYDEWRNRGADYPAYGSVDQTGGQYSNQLPSGGFRAQDATGRHRVCRQRKNYAVFRTRSPTGFMKKLRAYAVFSTRLAYVLQTGNGYELQIADADGQNPQVMLRSRHSIISPTWSPDGKKLGLRQL